jgi:hypothetical protein
MKKVKNCFDFDFIIVWHFDLRSNKKLKANGKIGKEDCD